MTRGESFEKAAKILSTHMTKEEFIEFGGYIDSDADYDFDEAINDEVNRIAPEVFAPPTSRMN